MKHVDIYTDGACSGNPGAGGWAAILSYKGIEKELSGYMKDTTNNRMELFAIIQGLKQLKERCEVTVYSDSAYSLNPFLEGWIDGWKAWLEDCFERRSEKRRSLETAAYRDVQT